MKRVIIIVFVISLLVTGDLLAQNPSAQKGMQRVTGSDSEKRIALVIWQCRLQRNSAQESSK